MEPIPESPRHRIAKLTADLHALHPALTQEVLTDAVAYGFAHSSRCTANDVDWMEGSLAQGKPMRRLRELLIPHGFKRGTALQTVVSPDASFQISSMRGNLNTGLERMPASRTERGTLTCEAINRNTPPPRNLWGEIAEKHIRTWVLLTYAAHDEHTGDVELRAELSLPTHVRGSGRRAIVDEFKPRFRLEPIHMEQASGSDVEAIDDDEIDIPVERRRAG